MELLLTGAVPIEGEMLGEAVRGLLGMVTGLPGEPLTLRLSTVELPAALPRLIDPERSVFKGALL